MVLIIRLIEDSKGSWRVCVAEVGQRRPQYDEPYVDLAVSWGRYGPARRFGDIPAISASDSI